VTLRPWSDRNAAVQNHTAQREEAFLDRPMTQTNYMARERSDLTTDYFVIIKPCGRPRSRWTWEIQRSSKPLGVKYEGDDFATPQDAKLAGVKALNALLYDLCQDKLKKIA